MPLREFSFALLGLASQFRAPARSGLSLFQPQPFAPKFSCPSGCRFSNHLLLGRSDIPQQRSLMFRSPVLPASVCASQNFRAKWIELQPSLSNAVFWSPCPSLLIQLVPPQCGHLHIPFAFFCAFVPRPLAIPSLPQTQFQPTRLQKRSS